MSISKNYQAIRTGIKFATEIFRQCRPKDTFDPKQTPPPYDYADVSSWAAHPKKPNKSNLTPEGIKAAENPEVDTFFVHPTSYFGQTNWNQPAGFNPATELVDEVIMPGQASVFNSATRVFAPYYRQATFYSFLAIRKSSARQAFQIAYEDVEKAFDHFIEHYNGDRPFILASHSQGTLHLIRLLEDRIDQNPELRSRLVAAYAIGFQFPRVKCGTTLKQINISQSPTDTGCVIAYDTYSYLGGPNHTLDRIEVWNNGGWMKRAHQPVIGVNPLSWTTEEVKVDSKFNRGAVHTIFEGKGYSVGEWFGNQKIGLNAKGLSAPIKGVVSAELDKEGFLYINTPKPKIFNVSVLPGYNYHNYDYALFYMDLRDNIIERVKAFKEKG